MNNPAFIGSELVPGALAPVKWEKICEGFSYKSTRVTFWRAIPPTSDYLALGCIASANPWSSDAPSQPPDSIAARFRAVHKRALTTATGKTFPIYWITHPSGTGNVGAVFGMDGRFISAETVLPNKVDCYKLDPKNVVQEYRW